MQLLDKFTEQIQKTMADLLSLLREKKTNELIGEIIKQPELANFRDPQGTSLLLLSVYYGNQQLKEFLIKGKKSFSIFEAVACGLSERAKEIIKNSPGEVNAFASDGFTPVGLASFFKQEDLVKSLIESGADINQPSRNSFKVAPLNSAAAAKNVAIAKLLLEYGADVNVKQQEGLTPLHSAAHNGDVAMTKLLLQYGADRTIKTDKGKIAYDYAAELDHKELMDILRV